VRRVPALASYIVGRICGGKIVEHWSVVDMARVLQAVGVLRMPPA
jgi:hypothetical protein